VIHNNRPVETWNGTGCRLRDKSGKGEAVDVDVEQGFFSSLHMAVKAMRLHRVLDGLSMPHSLTLYRREIHVRLDGFASGRYRSESRKRNNGLI